MVGGVLLLMGKAALQDAFLLHDLLHGLVQLAVGDLLNGDAHGLFLQHQALALGAGSDLTGAGGHHVHQLVTAGDLLQQFAHCGIQHHNSLHSFEQFQAPLLAAALGDEDG